MTQPFPDHLNILERHVWYADRLRERGINFDAAADTDQLARLYRENVNGNGKKPSANALTVRKLTTYSIRQVEWLEKPFLQRSAFHLLAGRKGTCKGTWICGLAARVTTGRMYGEPKEVLVITSEDSVELDFFPRLMAANGVPDLVTIINGPFKMPRDLGWLTDQARAIGNVGLVVIDPIGNHLGGADTDKEGQVREAIGPLNKIADELDTLIMGVRHLGKDTSRGVLSSVLGSTAWVDVPRCVILMAADDEDDMLFHAQVVAGNRGPKNSGLTFRLTLVDVPPARDITLTVGEGESRKDVEDLLTAVGGKPVSTSKSKAARELILKLLEDARPDALESDALDAQIAHEANVAAKTVQNIRTKLKNEGLVRIYAEKDEFGSVVRWMVQRTLAPVPDAKSGSGLGEAAEKSGSGFGSTKPFSSQIPSTSLERSIKGSGSPHPHIPNSGETEELDNVIPVDFGQIVAETRETG